jgi:hypothetical protein
MIMVLLLCNMFIVGTMHAWEEDTKMSIRKMLYKDAAEFQWLKTVSIGWIL